MKRKWSRREFLAASLRVGLTFCLADFMPDGKAVPRGDLGQYWVEGVQICPPGLGLRIAIVGVGRAGYMAMQKVVGSLLRRSVFALDTIARFSLPDAIAPGPEGIDLAFVIADASESAAQAVATLGSLFREAGVLTIGMIGEASTAQSLGGRSGMASLASKMDALILQAEKKGDITERAALMARGAICMIQLLVEPSLIYIDFSDIWAIMRNSGLAYMGHAVAVGEESLLLATRAALKSVAAFAPLERAERLLLGLGAGHKVMLSEVNLAAKQVYHAARPDAVFVYGMNVGPFWVPQQAEATLFATAFEGS